MSSYREMAQQDTDPPRVPLSSTCAIVASSPLFMVTREPSLNQLVAYLLGKRAAIQKNPGVPCTMTFSRANLCEVRAAFARMIRQGEARLHRLADLLCRTWFADGVEMSSVVIGEVEGSKERFTLIQRLSREELDALTDLDLGSRQLERLRFLSADEQRRALLVANFVEYQPRSTNGRGIHKIISRIKAEEEIWNKVVDEIFNLDELVRRDKQLCHLSRYVKDLFGIKIVVNGPGAARKLHEDIRSLEFASELLTELGVPIEDATRRPLIIEEKDYLGRRKGKLSGWQALKSVVAWWDGTFEIQVQPLVNYHRERERLTDESHTGFKLRREQLRDEIAARMPLFGFYRDLLRWLFLSPTGKAPEFPGVQIRILD